MRALPFTKTKYLKMTLAFNLSPNSQLDTKSCLFFVLKCSHICPLLFDPSSPVLLQGSQLRREPASSVITQIWPPDSLSPAPWSKLTDNSLLPTGEGSIFQPAIAGLLELACQSAQPHLPRPVIL